MNVLHFFGAQDDGVKSFLENANNNQSDEFNIDGDDELTVRVNRLEVLTLSNCRLVSVQFMLRFCNMKVLNISFNKIVEISSISALTQLIELDMSHNKIADLSPLQSLTQLKVLRCNTNKIASLQAIASLTHLEELWISQNSIDWTEFIHLSPLLSLLHIVAYSNPFEKKSKATEFLLSVCPAIKTVNGQDSNLFLNNNDSNSMQSQSFIDPSNFLKSADGRVMLNQARGLLTVESRDQLNSNLQVSALSPKKTRSNELDQFSQGILGYNGLRTKSEGGSTEKVRVFKVKKNKLPKQFMSSSNDVSNDSNISTTAVIVKFDDNNNPNARVALSLESNGTGYARWSKNGPIACSFDNFRLFSSYKSGSVAAVIDANGNGSIMSSKGDCLLNMRSGEDFSEVEVFVVEDTNTIKSKYRKYVDGKVECVYDQVNDDLTTRIHTWSMEGMRFTFSPLSWEVSIEFKNERLSCLFSSVTGGKLLEVREKKPKKISSQQSTSSVVDLYSEEEHVKARNDMKSLVSNLDSFIGEMNKKRNN